MKCNRSDTRRRLGLVLGGTLLSLTLAMPAVATTVDELCGASDDPCVVDEKIAVDDLSVLDVGDRSLVIADGGELDVGGGTMSIFAGRFTVEVGGRVLARGSGSLPGGNIVLGVLSADVFGTVDCLGSPPGQISVVATGHVNVSGVIEARSQARDQSGGTVEIEGASIEVSGEVNADAGTEDALGGDIEITATGDVDISGEVTVLGTDGGTITVTAGAGLSEGNIALEATSVLKANGINQGGFGGSVDLDASGDGQTSGLIRMSGSISVEGNQGNSEDGGGSGGCLSVNAVGGVIADNLDALLTVAGRGLDGDGGEFDIVSDFGAVVIAATVDVSGDGIESGGGSFAIDAVDNILVLGSIDATGGDGGDVAIVSSGGSVTVTEGLTIDVSGSDVGSGGGICLETASTRVVAAVSVVVNADLLADGGGSGGQGGAIELIGFDSARITGMASADGGQGGGLGGGIAVTSIGGTAFVEGTLRARGRGESGGAISVDGDRIEVPGVIDVSGAGAVFGGTDIGLRATGNVVVGGLLRATGAPGPGGLVEVISDGDVTIRGTLTADGGAEPGGTVTVRGCSVLVCGFNSLPEVCEGATGLLRTEGPSGTNRVTGRTNALIFGTMSTELAGRNEVVVPPPGAQNATVVGAVSPPVIVIEDGSLTACPVCGNGSTEPRETCDDGNTEDGDGCSAGCRFEGDFRPGDVNGDFLVNQEDLGFLAAEIFDGDGDSVSNVSGGGFAGGPGADVQPDGRISAADFSGLVRVLVGP